MSTEVRQVRERPLLRIGAVCAVIGTVFQVAAGSGSGNPPTGEGTAETLRWLAERPDWYWPAVYLGFMVGALLWVGAFTALAGSLTEGASWGLSRLALAAILAGVAIHIVDGTLNGVGLRLLVDDWASTSGAEQAAVVRDGATLLAILEGTWASAIIFYHGIPFILMGLAVVLSHRYPAWLGWIGIAGGVISMASGLAMFVDDTFPDLYYIAGALTISLFMVASCIPMWLLTGAPAPPAVDAHAADDDVGPDARREPVASGMASTRDREE
jgi:hypothetical protein